MKKSVLKVSFKLPALGIDWAGQALSDLLPEGLILGAADPAFVKVWGWLPSRTLLPALEARVRELGGQGLVLRVERLRDWLRESKARFPVQKLGGFLVVPAWRRVKVPPKLIPIRLLQGQAFGTGLHASTRLMLKAVEGLEAGKMRAVLDVGAGSGILAIACLKRGAGRVDAVEIETAACAEMRLNREENGIPKARMKVVRGDFPAIPAIHGRRYDLILANLTWEIVQPRLKALASMLDKGGRLWISGIFKDGEQDQLKRLSQKLNLKVVRAARRGLWWWLELTR